MLIKKEKQLKPGQLIKFNGPCVDDCRKTKLHVVMVKEIYSHWVLGEIIQPVETEGWFPKISMTNVDLLYQGIYDRTDVEGNKVYELTVKENKEENFNSVYAKFVEEAKTNPMQYIRTHQGE